LTEARDRGGGPGASGPGASGPGASGVSGAGGQLVGRGWPVLVAVLGVAACLVVVAVIRLALYGWAGIAPDDARYVFVGLSTLAGHGPITPSGNLFILRSPVYGIALAAGSVLSGADPIGGARVVAVALTLACLLAAARLGWVLGGAVGASATVLAILAMPLLWRLLPTLRVDLPQTAGVVVVLLALLRPTPRRWAVAGVIFGLTILVKETVLLLAVAPLAFVGSLPRERLARLWGVFLVAAAVVAGWWWVVVWLQSGAIFPLNAVGTIERRDVGSDIRLDTFGVALLIVIAVGWLTVLVGAWRDRGLRLLVAAGLCLVPPAAYATMNGLNARNYAGLAVLSAIAIGVAASQAVSWARSHDGGGLPRRIATVALIAVVSVAGAVNGQGRVGRPGEPILPGRTADWLRAETPSGAHVVMAFRYSEIVALRLFGEIAVPGIGASRVDGPTPLSSYMWIGLRDEQLFGYTRAGWVGSLSQPGTAFLVLAGPHALTPVELVPTLDQGGLPGVARATRFEDGDEWVAIYRVEPAAVRADPADVAVHLSPAAALAWIGLSSADTAAIDQLAQARAVIVGRDTRSLAQRLDGLACLVPLAGSQDTEARVVPIGPSCEAVGQP
jgi:hypothetical protein